MTTMEGMPIHTIHIYKNLQVYEMSKLGMSRYSAFHVMSYYVMTCPIYHLTSSHVMSYLIFILFQLIPMLVLLFILVD